jgi:hypothetical protein
MFRKVGGRPPDVRTIDWLRSWHRSSAREERVRFQVRAAWAPMPCVPCQREDRLGLATWRALRRKAVDLDIASIHFEVKLRLESQRRSAQNRHI